MTKPNSVPATGYVARSGGDRLEGNSPGLATRDQSGWPRRSRLRTSRHLGNPAYAATTSGTVQFSWFVQSVGDALVLCAGLTRFGRRGEAARCGQEDTRGTRAAFRAGGRQLAFRHRSQPCKRPALLAHIFVRRHRPPASGLNASRGGPVRRDCEKLYQFCLAGHNDRPAERPQNQRDGISSESEQTRPRWQAQAQTRPLCPWDFLQIFGRPIQAPRRLKKRM
jgi:hypothetical protein